jgi:hypothetical protein
VLILIAGCTGTQPNPGHHKGAMVLQAQGRVTSAAPAHRQRGQASDHLTFSAYSLPVVTAGKGK